MVCEDYLDALSTPLLHVQGADWTVTYANSAAEMWLGAKIGQPLQTVLPALDRAKAMSRLQRGRSFSLKQKTHTELAFSASYQFTLMPDGESALVEGRDDSPVDEAQSMINSYSKMVEQQKIEIEAEKAHVEKLLLNILPRNTTRTQSWQCRIGIHSGPVIAGIVGQVKYIYDIFGDGVNTAARMESHSEPMCINISKNTHQKIADSFVCEPRGWMPVKGKGDQEMFYVLGRVD